MGGGGQRLVKEAEAAAGRNLAQIRPSLREASAGTNGKSLTWVCLSHWPT